MKAESVLIMNVITDKLRGKYLLRIKTLVSSDINGIRKYRRILNDPAMSR